jgi:hypothetical protein
METMSYPENYEGATTWSETVTVNRWPFSWPQRLTFTILQSKGYGAPWCGYVRFARRPLRERDYHGIATYVPVHGGITYAEGKEGSGMVYGFDCGHSGDEKRPETKDRPWLQTQCRVMAVGILLAARYESHYLLAKTEKEKALVVDKYHDDLKKNYGIDFVLKDNFGAMINVMFGGL